MGEIPLTRVEVLIALLLLLLAGDSREALAAALRKAERYGPILFSSSVTSQPPAQTLFIPKLCSHLQLALDTWRNCSTIRSTTSLAWCILSTFALLLPLLGEKQASERRQLLSLFCWMLILLQGASWFVLVAEAASVEPVWMPGVADVQHRRTDVSGVAADAGATVWHSSAGSRAVQAPPPLSKGVEQGAFAPSHGRGLTSVTVSSFEELKTQLAGSAATIRLEAGTYSVTSTLTISRDVTLTADVEGSSVVLDGGNARRVMTINSGTVQLTGLTITNGYSSVRHASPMCTSKLCSTSEHRDAQKRAP